MNLADVLGGAIPTTAEERLEVQMEAFAILASRGHIFNLRQWNQIREAANAGNYHALWIVGRK
jgi:hypothetical protein